MPMLSLWLLLLTTFLAAQGDGTFTLAADSLQNGQSVDLSKLNWKYRPGDDPAWAEPELDDREWETLNGGAIMLALPPKSGWNGIGWFRLHLSVDPLLVRLPLNLEMYHLGASEIYLDGRLIGRFGRVNREKADETAFNPNASPLGIAFDSNGEHIIAVRYSNQQAHDFSHGWAKWLTERGIRTGFRARIKRFGDSANQGYGGNFTFGYDIFQSAIFLALGLFHLLLYTFYPNRRGNLFYSLFLLGGAFNNFFAAQFISNHFGVKGYYILDLANQLVGVPSFLAFLFSLYTVFYPRIPRYIWLFIAACLLGLILFNLFPGAVSFRICQLTLMAILVESDRVMIRAMLKRMEGALFVGCGTLLYSLLSLREFFSPILHIQIIGFWYIAIDAIANYGLVFSTSVYLARKFAVTSKKLEAQIKRVQALSAKELEAERREAEIRLLHEQEKARRAMLEAENERKSRELEEARQLQLSMLPKKVPQLPDLEIAAYMKTASEVGGDYYDFHLGEDGTLTVAVGDATGHGLKASTMVSSVKSLFIALADHPDLTHIFHQMSRVLKEMKLRGLFMAMTMIKVKGNQLTVSITGMPPVLVYRAASGDVEEIALRALPLGSIASYQYKQQELAIAPGDVVVLMSDGLPERFNAENEMLDYRATKRALAVAARQSPHEIIEHFVRVGDEWSNGRPQDDDVTFVVLKVRDRQDGFADAPVGKRIGDN